MIQITIIFCYRFLKHNLDEVSFTDPILREKLFPAANIDPAQAQAHHDVLT